MTINNPKYYTAREKVTVGLGKGIVTLPSDPEQIPSQAAQDSLGFISSDGQIELCKGRLLIGAQETANGNVHGEGWGYTVDGVKVHFRKTNTKIQYYNTTTLLWVDIVTGLTSGAEYTFSAYQSLAGTFVYATGIDGIYKIHTASPGDYCSMYDATKNYKGKSMITQSRMSMWNVKGSLTTHFLSYTDSAQDSTVYTAVSAEATTSLTGTLAFKAGDAKRTCFGLVATHTVSGEVFTDNYNGTLTGSLGNTGTINYTTGAYTFSIAGVGTVNYSWEMTNNKGITDFTFSGTRTALQGDVVRQDEGGDAIGNILFHDGTYYSFKSRSVYSLTIADTGLTFNNKVFRKTIGLAYWRAVTATSKGIIFMDAANPDKPQLTILQPNLQGDNLEPVVLASHFDFSKYIFDDCGMETFGEYIVFSARNSSSTVNNKLFFYNVRLGSVDILPYGATTITTSDGLLYIGDTITENIYEILSGFDDDNNTIENYWISNDEKFGAENLKKVKRLRFKGLITPEQGFEVYTSYDNDTYTLVGTILGSGAYVDPTQSYTIGSQGIGTSVIGGESTTVLGNFYLAELKISTPKFRKRSIKIKAIGTGYLSINLIEDYGISTFEQKLPSKYRSRQNVSLDGTITDQSTGPKSLSIGNGFKLLIDTLGNYLKIDIN